MFVMFIHCSRPPLWASISAAKCRTSKLFVPRRIRRPGRTVDVSDPDQFLVHEFPDAKTGELAAIREVARHRRHVRRSAKGRRYFPIFSGGYFLNIFSIAFFHWSYQVRVRGKPSALRFVLLRIHFLA